MSKRATALKYEGGGAPKVVATGNGLVAERILELAREAGGPIHEDAALAAAARSRCEALRDLAEERRLRGELLAELPLQLAVDLADTALGDTEDVADLTKGQVLHVEEDGDLALALRQAAERLAELLLGLA